MKNLKLAEWVGIAVVAVLVCVGVWMLAGDAESGEETSRPTAARERGAGEAVAGKEENEIVPEIEAAQPREADEKPYLLNRDGSKLYLKDGDVVGSNIFVTAQGTMRMLPKAPSSGLAPVFENDVHAMMASYVQPGVDMPPPEHVSDEDALAACDAAIEILDDDSPGVRREKEIVAAMRDELREHLASGGSADSYFQMLQQRQEAEAEAVREVRRHVNELINDDQIEDAIIALGEFNKYLDAKGIPPLRIKRLNRYMQGGGEQ